MKRIGDKIPNKNKSAIDVYNSLPKGTKTSPYEAKRTLEAIVAVRSVPLISRRIEGCTECTRRLSGSRPMK